MSALTPAQMRAVEDLAERWGLTRRLLMENAGHGIAAFLHCRYPDLHRRRIVIIAGTGNNGGDGFATARHLAARSVPATVILLGQPSEIRTAEAHANWDLLEHIAPALPRLTAPDVAMLQSHQTVIEQAQLVLDAIFGTGIRGRLGPLHAGAIDAINNSKGVRMAVDVPSGLDPATGQVQDRAVRAHTTLTLHAPKAGLLQAPEYVGELVVIPIGVPRRIEEEGLRMASPV